LVLDYVLIGIALLFAIGGYFSWTATAILVALGYVGYFVLARKAWNGVTIARRLLGVGTEPAAAAPSPNFAASGVPETHEAAKFEPPGVDSGPGLGNSSDRRGLPRVPWSVGAPLIAVAPLLLLVIPAVFLGDSSEAEEGISTAGAVIAQLLLSAYLFGTAFGVAKAKGDGNPLSLLGFRRTSLMQFGAPAAAAGFYIAFTIGWAIVVSLLELSAEQEDVTQSFGSDTGAGGLILAGVLIVLVAPLVEEGFFRGFVFGGFRSRFAFWPAALLSGFIFGAIHFTGPDSIGIVPQLAAFGVALAWVYEKTRSLWHCVFLHVLNNAVAFTVLATEGRLHL